jgi:hypothetical protein
MFHLVFPLLRAQVIPNRDNGVHTAPLRWQTSKGLVWISGRAIVRIGRVTSTRHVGNASKRVHALP